jgi:hypothetical protein
MKERQGCEPGLGAAHRHQADLGGRTLRHDAPRRSGAAGRGRVYHAAGASGQAKGQRKCLRMRADGRNRPLWHGLLTVPRRVCVLDGPDGGGQIAEGGDDVDRRVAGQLAQPAERCQTVHARQAHIEDDRVGLSLGGELERLLGGGCGRGGMALGGQGALQRPADGFLVINDQDVFPGTPRFRPWAGGWPTPSGFRAYTTYSNNSFFEVRLRVV